MEENQIIMACGCPSCGEQVRFRKPAKGGKYKFACPKCKETFVVEIPDDEAPAEQPTENAEAPAAPQAAEKPAAAEQPAVPETKRVWRPNDRYTTIGGLREKHRGFFGKDKVHPLREGRQLLGRMDDRNPSDIMFDDPHISRQSIEINVETQQEGGSRYFIYVMTVKRQMNPVMHNGEPLQNGEEIILHIGDTIKVGKTHLTLQ